MNWFRKVSGRPSMTQVFNAAWLVLALATLILGYFGYDEFTPHPMLVQVFTLIIGPIINMILRKYFTKEPIA